MRGHLLGDGGGGGHDKRPELLPRALLLYLVSDRVEYPRVDALAALLGGVADLVFARRLVFAQFDRDLFDVLSFPLERRAALRLGCFRRHRLSSASKADVTASVAPAGFSRVLGDMTCRFFASRSA